MENMGKGQTHQLKMCATGSSLFSQSQFQGCMLQKSVFHGNMFWVAHSFLIPEKDRPEVCKQCEEDSLQGEVEILARVRDQLILKN